MKRRNGMKTRAAFRLVAIVVALAAILSGCDLFKPSVSIAERIALFQDDLNKADRSQAYLNFNPALTQDYASLKGLDWWNTNFPPKGTGSAYSAAVTSQTDASAVLITISGPALYGPPKNYKLAMAVDSENAKDWRIRTLSVGSGTPITWTVLFK